MIKLCNDLDIKPIVRVEIRVASELYYICLAKNQKSVGDINRLLTHHNCDGIEIPEHNPVLKNTIFIYPLHNIPEVLEEDEYVGIRPEELNYLVKPDLKKLIDKMVIIQPVKFTSKLDYNLHKILRAIDNNTLISKLGDHDYC